MKKTCAVLVWRNSGSEPCGAKANATLTLNGDSVFAICQRHDARLRRAIPYFEVWQPEGEDE